MDAPRGAQKAQIDMMSNEAYQDDDQTKLLQDNPELSSKEWST